MAIQNNKNKNQTEMIKPSIGKDHGNTETLKNCHWGHPLVLPIWNTGLQYPLELNLLIPSGLSVLRPGICATEIRSLYFRRCISECS